VLLIDAYSQGVRSSPVIERLWQRDAGYRVALRHPIIREADGDPAGGPAVRICTSGRADAAAAMVSVFQRLSLPESIPGFLPPIAPGRPGLTAPVHCV
jgi:hypothetical protein